LKKILATILLGFVFFANFTFVEARSGCCSHHGGVCGCGCCDGTSLSTTCAPYYPNCGRASVSETITIPEVASPKVEITHQPAISEFSLALTYAQNQKVAYSKNPHGFREKLIFEMIDKYKNLSLNNIGFIVYSTLKDIK
jgi:hypothetical protein